MAENWAQGPGLYPLDQRAPQQDLEVVQFLGGAFQRAPGAALAAMGTGHRWGVARGSGFPGEKEKRVRER